MCQTLNYGYCIMNCSRECYKAKAEFWTSKTVLKPCLGKFLRNICWCSSQLRNALFEKESALLQLAASCSWVRRHPTETDKPLWRGRWPPENTEEKSPPRMKLSRASDFLPQPNLCILQCSPSLITSWPLKLTTVHNAKAISEIMTT